MTEPCASISALDASNGELQAAIRTAQKMLTAYGDSSGFGEFGYAQAHGALSESLRILLRALGVEADIADSGKITSAAAEVRDSAGQRHHARVTRSRNLTDLHERCPAAHVEDPTPCDGPAVVTVLDRGNAGADGCEHHAARLLASLDRARVYGLPDAPAGTAVRVHKAAAGIRPFPWVDGPRTKPSQLSHDENRARGEGQ